MADQDLVGWRVQSLFLSNRAMGERSGGGLGGKTGECSALAQGWGTRVIYIHY
jgi:hypothetical protein